MTTIALIILAAIILIMVGMLHDLRIQVSQLRSSHQVMDDDLNDVETYLWGDEMEAAKLRHPSQRGRVA